MHGGLTIMHYGCWRTAVVRRSSLREALLRPQGQRLLFSTANGEVKVKAEAMQRKDDEQVRQSSTSRDVLAAPRDVVGETDPKEVLPRKASLKQRLIDGFWHYVHGAKLFGKETALSTRLMYKSLVRREKLNRRENIQLARTFQDLLRLIPFSVFIIVPFMELLLPVAIKYFPNLLPSTFEEKEYKQEKRVKTERLQLEAARKIHGSFQASESLKLDDLFKMLHLSGQSIATTDIVKVAKSLPRLDVESLNRAQLVLICQYLGLNTIGPSYYLQNQLRATLVRLMKDDLVIEDEGGVDNLSDEELFMACHDRGIKVLDVDKAVLQSDLQQWIDLHLRHEMSPLLLVTTRVLIMHARDHEAAGKLAQKDQ